MVLIIFRFLLDQVRECRGFAKLRGLSVFTQVWESRNAVTDGRKKPKR